MKKTMAVMVAMMVAAGSAWTQPGDTGGPGRHGKGGHRHGGAHAGMDFLHPRLLKELGLTEEQRSRLKEQRLENQKKRIQLKGEKAALELDLQNVFSTVPMKEAEARKIADRIAEVDRKILLMRVESMSRFLAGLTPDQHRKVMEYQAEMREKRKAWREEMGKRLPRGAREPAEAGKEGEDGP